MLSKRQGADPYIYADSDDSDESANNSKLDALTNEALAEADGETKPEGDDIGVVDDPDSNFIYINDLANNYFFDADPSLGTSILATQAKAHSLPPLLVL